MYLKALKKVANLLVAQLCTVRLERKLFLARIAERRTAWKLFM